MARSELSILMGRWCFESYLSVGVAVHVMLSSPTRTPSDGKSLQRFASFTEPCFCSVFHLPIVFIDANSSSHRHVRGSERKKPYSASVCMGRDSPASNGGRGLKLRFSQLQVRRRADSPASNGGRGLKLGSLHGSEGAGEIRPPAMAGAD